MKACALTSVSSLAGTVTVPGDKSIAHRSIIVSALSEGTTVIEHFPDNDDCRATIEALRAVQVPIRQNKRSQRVIVSGRGLCGLQKPRSPLFVGESGTTCRLLIGVLAGAGVPATITARASLCRRPMRRVTHPLRLMGASIAARRAHASGGPEEYLPITVSPASLHAISYRMPVASAQVKSAVLLAGLFAKGVTQVSEPEKTRDHTERMLRFFGGRIHTRGAAVSVTGGRVLTSPGTFAIPGDISSAAFFLVLGALVPHARITIANVSLNPTRGGIVSVLKRMGGRITVKKGKNRFSRCEPVGDLIVSSHSLRGTTVKKAEIPTLIDELPVLMVAAALAKGRSVFESVGELRVKETDRIHSMVENLRLMGARIRVRQGKGSREDIVIEGTGRLCGAKVKSYGDHRTAMSMMVAGCLAQGKTVIDDIRCIAKSYPDFPSTLKKLLSK